jgi:transcriptional regulator with XRE-family HTH domain
MMSAAAATNLPLVGMPWLSDRMAKAGIKSLDELQLRSGINKGTLSKYFRHLQSPSVAVIPALCSALGVSPEDLLTGLGVIRN